ncbi:S-layer homology domain-containing protein [Bifidobacterium magnum]|nr:S-layer homology domain-containing protein [Bifidobacterium magnum]
MTFVNSPTKLPEDVRSFTPHVTDIAWLKDQGITQGFPDGTYRGMSSVVRQDMAAFLHRLDTHIAK